MTSSPSRLPRAALLGGGLVGVGVLAIALLSGSPAEEPESVDAGTPRRAAPRRVERVRGVDGGISPPRLTLAPRADAGLLEAPPAALEREATAGPVALRDPIGKRLVLRGGRPTLPPAATAAVGSMDRETIRDAISAIRPLVAACYEQGLKQDPHLQGDATLSFTIVAKDGVGLVREAEFVEERSSMADVLVQACMLEALSRAKFPAPSGDGETRVTYPFKFASKPDAGAP